MYFSVHSSHSQVHSPIYIILVNMTAVNADDYKNIVHWELKYHISK